MHTFLKKVIHDWDDDRAVSILKNCRVAMNGMARLLLIEPVIPSGKRGKSFNKLVDLMMLVWTSGGKRADGRGTSHSS